MHTNPVYLELTRHSGWPSPRQARRLEIVAALTGAVLALAILFLAATVSPNFEALAALLGLSAAAFILLAPSLALMITALRVSQHIAQGNLDVLRLTAVPPERIADAYIAGSTHRVRLLRSTDLALSLLVLIISAYWLGQAAIWRRGLIGPPWFGWRELLSTLYVGLAPALIVTGALVWNGLRMLRLAIYAGVWIGLRWRERAPSMAGGVLLAAWMALALLAWIVAGNIEWWPVYYFPCALAIIAAPFGFDALARLALRRTRRAVETE